MMQYKHILAAFRLAPRFPVYSWKRWERAEKRLAVQAKVKRDSSDCNSHKWAVSKHSFSASILWEPVADEISSRALLMISELVNI